MLLATIDESRLDIELAEEFAPSNLLAQFAREELREAQEINQRALGYVPAHETVVDGVRGVSEDLVRPGGVIVYEFKLATDLLEWIADQLRRHAPVLTGRFRDSFKLFADGVETEIGDHMRDSAEYVFVSPLPYARKIERGESDKAPDGVFEAVATLAAQRFGNQAQIRFSYRAPFDGVILTGRPGDRSDHRTPSIVVTLRG